MSGPEVERNLDKYKELGIIRESPVPDEKGRKLFTLAANSSGWAEVINIMRGAVSKSVS